MGIDINDIINTIFGSDGTVKEESGVNTTTQKGTVGETGTNITDKKSSSTQGSVSEGDSTQKTTTKSDLQTLDDSSIANLQTILGKLTKDFNPADLSEIKRRITGSSDLLASGSDTFLKRALSGDQELAATIDPILAAARLKTERDVGSQVRAASENAGTGFSSLVADVGARAFADANINIAALGAQLTTQNRKQVTDEIVSALTNLNAATSTLATAGIQPYLAEAEINAGNASAAASIANALKGGKQTGTTVTDTSGHTRTESQTTTNMVGRDTTNINTTKNVDLNNVITNIGKVNTEDKTSLIDLFNSILGN